jgi:RNA polymerase sigma factor (sigma-70 family)
MDGRALPAFVQGAIGPSLAKTDTAHTRFAEVFLPHLVDAYRLARWLAGTQSDAEDIVQEASLRAFRGIAGFDGVNARAWTLTIVRNAAYTWLARNRKGAVVLSQDLNPAEQARIEQSIEDEGMETPEAVLIAKNEAEGIRQRMAALPPPFREVLVLREIHQLSYDQIAAMIDAPIGTVMSRLARARRALTGISEGGP